MHVGFALLTLFPGRMGGSESTVRGLLAEFARGHGPDRLTMLANRHVSAGYGDFARGPVELHEVRGYRPGDGTATRTLAMAGAALAPRLAARDIPSDLDIVHHPLTVPLPRPRGVPLVTTVHDLQHHELPQLFSRAERLWRRWAYDGAARRAEAVITPSNHSRERLVELLGLDPSRVEVVPWGIDHSRFGSHGGEADERLAPRLPERFVVYPANMWPHKNHSRLVEALARVEQDDLHLVLTGQGYAQESQLLAQAARLGVERRVRHLGYLPSDLLPALYRAAEAVVFPSLYEGFGSPPLEAMACGCPVASSQTGALGETAGPATLGLDPRSPESIAHAIDRVTRESELRERLRDRGLRHAATFTWQACAQRHDEVYARVGATSPSRTR
ncbi:MAG: glycosyltransferase family 4 protein [Thermoleophilaceae bacterium]